MKRMPLTTYDQAYRYTLRLLQRQSYSQKAIEQKLQLRQAPTPIAQQVIERLIKLGLIDDARYAASLARTEATYRHRSQQQIEQKLFFKGVPRDIIATALADPAGDAPEERERAKHHLERWIRRHGPLATYPEKQKAKAMLYRKGFSLPVINDVLTDTTRIDDD